MSLERFFTSIRDGTWHSIEELTHELDMPDSKLKELSSFLCKHGLLKYEEESCEIKLEPKWKLLLPQEEETTEPKTTVATFFIPPDASIEVQSTQIRNLSSIELEISARMDSRIREIAIKI